MIVVCEKCRSRLRLSESDLNNAPPKLPVRCSRCRHSFTITLPDSLPRNQPVNLPLADETTHNSATIVITNQKGGVAKTSTCLNLGLSLSLMKKSVLLIDFDMQANLTLSLGYQKTSSFYDVFQNGWQKLDSALIQTPYPGLWLLPSNKNMVLLSKKCFGGKDYEFILKSHLSQVQDRFDYIIIDTPPSIEFFTINALSASHLAIIPTQCDYLSVHGVEQVLSFINLIRKKTNP
ncbi:MAG TPA: hypothetical protein ENN66_11135, partial [Proteobacteria bacterium]|nr:hypothetical protein [Pseudomonadota bacterium]